MKNNNITLKSVVAAISLIACAGLVSPQIAVGQTPAAPSSATPFVLTLSTGFQKVISLPGIPARVSIGDPSIASVTVLKPTDRGGKNAGVLVTGLKTGSTSLLIWGRGASMPRVIAVAVIGKAAETIAKLKDLNLETEGQVLKLSGSTPNVSTYQQARESLIKPGSD